MNISIFNLFPDDTALLASGSTSEVYADSSHVWKLYEAQAWDEESPGKRSYATEVLILRLLKEHALGLLPFPELLSHGEVLETEEHSHYIYMTRCLGDPMNDALTEKHAHAIGRMIGVFHGLSAQFPKQELRNIPINASLGLKLLNQSTLPGALLGKIENLVSRSGFNAQDLVLTHGDIYPANIIYTDHSITGLIDFGECGFNVRETDFLYFWDFYGPQSPVFLEIADGYFQQTGRALSNDRLKAAYALNGLLEVETLIKAGYYDYHIQDKIDDLCQRLKILISKSARQYNPSPKPKLG